MNTAERAAEATECPAQPLLRHAREERGGLLFFERNMVWRGAYRGRDILAPNSADADADARGFFAVERWIGSLVSADQPEPPGDERKKSLEGWKEGLSVVNLSVLAGEEGQGLSGGPRVVLRCALEACRDALCLARCFVQLLGHKAAESGDVDTSGFSLWPLTKILDIGGQACPAELELPDGSRRVTDEVPPIPAHVHAGVFNDTTGTVESPGKKEAYFFPPLDSEPYCRSGDAAGVVTRLGIKPGVTREQFFGSMEQFAAPGHSGVYGLLNEFEVKAYDGWTIECGVVHAPGPRLTLEMQRPQDDFNMCSWTLGSCVESAAEREILRNDYQLRGLPNARQVFEQCVDFDLNIPSKRSFRDAYFHSANTLESDADHQRFRTFACGFVGDGIRVNAGALTELAPSVDAMVVLVWSGSGQANGQEISATVQGRDEFLVMPNTPLRLESTTGTPLLVFRCFPMDPNLL